MNHKEIMQHLLNGKTLINEDATVALDVEGFTVRHNCVDIFYSGWKVKPITKELSADDIREAIRNTNSFSTNYADELIKTLGL